MVVWWQETDIRTAERKAEAAETMVESLQQDLQRAQMRHAELQVLLP